MFGGLGCRSQGSALAGYSIPPDAQRIRVLQLRRELGVRAVLPGDGAAEADDRQGADGAATSIGGRREGAAVDDAVADLEAGGEAVNLKRKMGVLI